MKGLGRRMEEILYGGFAMFSIRVPSLLKHKKKTLSVPSSHLSLQIICFFHIGIDTTSE